MKLSVDQLNDLAEIVARCRRSASVVEGNKTRTIRYVDAEELVKALKEEAEIRTWTQ